MTRIKIKGGNKISWNKICRRFGYSHHLVLSPEGRTLPSNTATGARQAIVCILPPPPDDCILLQESRLFFKYCCFPLTSNWTIIFYSQNICKPCALSVVKRIKSFLVLIHSTPLGIQPKLFWITLLVPLSPLFWVQTNGSSFYFFFERFNSFTETFVSDFILSDS